MTLVRVYSRGDCRITYTVVVRTRDFLVFIRGVPPVDEMKRFDGTRVRVHTNKLYHSV